MCFTVPANDSNTIWHSLTEQGAQVDRQCGQGYCGACKVKLISGEVRYTTEPLAFIGKGEALSCCSVPVSECEVQPL
ncbi:2Fe-2S iron-sulfur cluster-binding protein [Aeromonas caviae]|jgi:ferredoxin|uniref:2Fe-2S iron-sulfur cluster-binding protein n=1 Tax=Aeromonas caviae TaxID=648 RepID=UPI00385CC3CF